MAEASAKQAKKARAAPEKGQAKNLRIFEPSPATPYSDITPVTVRPNRPRRPSSRKEPDHLLTRRRSAPAAISRGAWTVSTGSSPNTRTSPIGAGPGTRLLLWVKSNLSELRTGLEFKPATTSITTKRGTTIKTVKVEWSPAPVMMNGRGMVFVGTDQTENNRAQGCKGRCDDLPA